MFESRGPLPVQLAADLYRGEASLASEAAIFARAWHYVGPTDLLRRDGDYFTATVCEVPIVVWRTRSGLRSFVNVCPHRFATIAAGVGRASRLRCPYHGWEFSETGASAKIPLASEFRPLGDAETRLTEASVVACGPTVFVRLPDGLKPGGLPLSRTGSVEPETFELADILGEAFPGDRRPMYRGRFEVAANWKLVLENAIESYHVDEVHSATFGRSPPAEACVHRFGDGWSAFETIQPAAGRVQRLADAIVYPLIGLRRDPVYLQVAAYPGLMFGRAGLISWVHVVRPKGPETAEVSMDLFAERSRRGPVARALVRLFAIGATRFTIRALREDATVLARVQAGIRSPLRPSEGLLSPREERIHHFHSWYSREVTGLPSGIVPESREQAKV